MVIEILHPGARYNRLQNVNYIGRYDLRVRTEACLTD
jgi:hypothetical protein